MSMVTLNNEQAQFLHSFLKDVRCNFKHYTGMDKGFSTIHNIYPNDLRVIDEVLEKIGESV